MQLKYKDEKFVCVTTYSEKDIPKSAGFRWNPDDKVWWSDDHTRALKLKRYAVDQAIKILEEFEAECSSKLEASKATDSEIEIPVPEGLEYMNFQKAGIEFCLKVFGDI